MLRELHIPHNDTSLSLIFKGIVDARLEKPDADGVKPQHEEDCGDPPMLHFEENIHSKPVCYLNTWDSMNVHYICNRYF
jgi:hypothetical protein